MDDDKWFVVLILGLILCGTLYYFVQSNAQDNQKQMCVDAGMTYKVDDDQVVCVDSDNT